MKAAISFLICYSDPISFFFFNLVLYQYSRVNFSRWYHVYPLCKVLQKLLLLAFTIMLHSLSIKKNKAYDIFALVYVFSLIYHGSPNHHHSAHNVLYTPAIEYFILFSAHSLRFWASVFLPAYFSIPGICFIMVNFPLGFPRNSSQM